ncbi:hypothetical protein QQM39_40975 [Streptomyces sp. DT2A-34]|uniref:hypothetical protein n=1 Tax=Streptomyces sp. DT2A-34 TaxID=3051182 RepID=UPI00265BA323|nr:hypothetical protein [Streptomyces sp. DT2A-34]MDO0916956.1 hypothetical protein [Streptomyces sp. DT2A-34]
MLVAGRWADDGTVEHRRSGPDVVRDALHALGADGVGLDVEAREPVPGDGCGDLFGRVRRAEGQHDRAGIERLPEG